MRKVRYTCDRCGEEIFETTVQGTEIDVPRVRFDSYSVSPFGSLQLSRERGMDLCHACNVELLDFLRFKVRADAKNRLELDYGVRPRFGDKE